MVWTPDTAEIEDGTGKSGAVVYEAPATGITWLNTRGKTSFSGATDANMERYAVEAVEAVQDILLQWGFESPPTVTTQSLLFPARGAYRWDSRLFDQDEIPTHLNEAIRLTEEEMAAGTWFPADEVGDVEEIQEGGVTVKYSESSASSLQAAHPEVARRLRRCLPP